MVRVRHEAGGLHGLIDGLAAAMHEHGLHADVVQEDDVGEDVGEGRFIIHDRAADLDDDDLVMESLDVGERLNEGGCFGDSLFHLL